MEVVCAVKSQMDVPKVPSVEDTVMLMGAAYDVKPKAAIGHQDYTACVRNTPPCNLNITMSSTAPIIVYYSL